MDAPTVPTIGCDTSLLTWKETFEFSFREVGSVLQLRWNKWTSSADVILYIIDSNNEDSLSSSLIGLLDVIHSFDNLIQSESNSTDKDINNVNIDNKNQNETKTISKSHPKIFIVFNKFDRYAGGIGYTSNDEENKDMNILFRQLLQRHPFNHLLQSPTKNNVKIEMICISAKTGLNIANQGGLLDRISKP